MGRIVAPGQPGQKVCKILYQKKELGVVIHACHYSYGKKCKIGGLVQANLEHKGAGDVAQAVESLPGNCEALISNPSITKKTNPPPKRNQKSLHMWYNVSCKKNYHWLRATIRLQGLGKQNCAS
jgi:hypothetical protein